MWLKLWTREEVNRKTVEYVWPSYFRMTHILQVNKLGKILLQVVGQWEVEYWARRTRRLVTDICNAVEFLKNISQTRFSSTVMIGKPHASWFSKHILTDRRIYYISLNKFIGFLRYVPDDPGFLRWELQGTFLFPKIAHIDLGSDPAAH